MDAAAIPPGSGWVTGQAEGFAQTESHGLPPFYGPPAPEDRPLSAQPGEQDAIERGGVAYPPTVGGPPGAFDHCLLGVPLDVYQVGHGGEEGHCGTGPDVTAGWPWPQPTLAMSDSDAEGDFFAEADAVMRVAPLQSAAAAAPHAAPKVPHSSVAQVQRAAGPSSSPGPRLNHRQLLSPGEDFTPRTVPAVGDFSSSVPLSPHLLPPVPMPIAADRATAHTATSGATALSATAPAGDRSAACMRSYQRTAPDRKRARPLTFAEAAASAGRELEAQNTDVMNEKVNSAIDVLDHFG